VISALAEDNPREAATLLGPLTRERVPADLWPDVLYLHGFAQERVGEARAALETYGEVLRLEEARGGDKASLAILHQHIAQLKREFATFDEALTAYRDAMHRSRDFIIEHGIVSVPDDEHLDVVPTPVYLRNLVPFAAYFDPPKFEARRKGLYIVTPSVNGEERAMREHNYASIGNTSIHEAYPGHHLQLHVAGKHPSLTRLQVDAPEFTEGWGMYSELLMREQGFDDGPEARLMLHTDAIWRACRIVLDVRMHRGEMTIDESIDFLVRNTSFERANARAEVRRYTFTPTYQLSYLLGRQLILELRADERRRLGADFDLRRFHDALLEAGSIPISFQRRALRGSATLGGASDTAAAAR